MLTAEFGRLDARKPTALTAAVLRRDAVRISIESSDPAAAGERWASAAWTDLAAEEEAEDRLSMRADVPPGAVPIGVR
jgi:hypothetical protein